MSKNILFITDYWHPNMSAGAICIKQIANRLIEIDPSNTVYIMALTGIQECPMYEIIDNKVTLINIQVKRLIDRKRIEAKIKGSRGLKKKYYSTYLIMHKFKYISISLFGRYSLKKDFISAYSNQLKKLEDIDIIIPSCFPFESIISSLDYKKNNEVKIIPMLYDLFSESETLHWNSINKKLKYKFNLSLEKKMFDECTRVLFIQNWKAHIEKNFSEYSFKYKLCGIPLLIEHREIKKNNDKRIKILFSGSINEKDRSAKYTCELIREVLRVNKDLYFIFHVIGTDIDPFVKLEMEFKNNVQFIQNVSLDKVALDKDNCDLFLSIGNKNAIQIPSKIFDYISYGKPIIHLFKDKNDVVIDLLERYDLCTCIEENRDLLDYNVNKLLAFIGNSRGKKKMFSDLKKIYYANTPDAVVFDILEILNRNKE